MIVYLSMLCRERIGNLGTKMLAAKMLLDKGIVEILRIV